MTMKASLRLVIPGVITTSAMWQRPSKVYCHFYEALQSVCLLTRPGGDLTGISSHRVSAYEDDPRVPYYQSSNWKPDPTKPHLSVNRRGVKSYMLYRTDEVGLRDHDMLPPWLKKTRDSNVFRLPSYGSGPPSYEEAMASVEDV
ncbi:hypothetical protein FOZ63_033523 [Perkinsus olseni]|uniref:Uncharacterized protein n=1 Tax=Perkinsus olseni TaxID=32597 RepID=A0A7J6UA36_PEROL|nr:hypothetical protein FOZ63_033523 [Perkinsus olseni]